MRPTQGEPIKLFRTRKPGYPIRAQGTLPQEGKPKQSKDKENFGIAKPLRVFFMN